MPIPECSSVRPYLWTDMLFCFLAANTRGGQEGTGSGDALSHEKSSTFKHKERCCLQELQYSPVVDAGWHSAPSTPLQPRLELKKKEHGLYAASLGKRIML